MLTLYAFGRLRLVDPEGQDRAPSGKKARGLIALLALAPGHLRARGWLQDKLWSDRGPEQAAGSLRQSLSEIRRALGPFSSILVTPGGLVGLDSARFRVRFDPPGGVTSDCELFEDLDIRDPEFENWLRDQRQLVTPGADSGLRADRLARPLVMIELESDGSDGSHWLLRDVENQIAHSLLEYGDVTIVDGSRRTGSIGGRGRRGLVVVLDCALLDGAVRLSARLEQLAEAAVYAVVRGTAPRNGTDPAGSPGVGQFVNQVVVRALDTLAHQVEEVGTHAMALALFNKARHSLFRLGRTDLAQADRLLQLAYESEPRAQFLAWRSFIRNTAHFEHRTHEFLDENLDQLTLIDEALRDGSTNSLVLALASQAHYVGATDIPRAARLARLSIERNPSNSLGWAFLSNALLGAGDAPAAAQAAAAARNLVKNTPYEYFYEIFGCMAAAGMRDYETAIELAEGALAFMPRFIAPRRYLVALYKATGRTRELEDACSALRRTEPDFSVNTLLDPQYPVGTLRRMPLIDAIA